MEDNEIIPINGTFYLKSSYHSMSDAKRDPMFFESLTEILCITLEVGKDDLYDRINHILYNDSTFNKRCIERDFSSDEWDKISYEMGISQAEFDFWERVLGEGLDKEAFLQDKIQYLEENLKVQFSDLFQYEIPNVLFLDVARKRQLYERIRIFDNDGSLYKSYFQQEFEILYRDQLYTLQSQSKDAYTAKCYESWTADHSVFKEKVSEYTTNLWIDKIIFKSDYYSEEDIRSLFDSKTKQFYGFVWDGRVHRPIAIRKEYDMILMKNNLSECDIQGDKKLHSLCLFPGHEDELALWISSKSTPNKDKEGNQNSEDNSPIQILQKGAIAVDNQITDKNTSGKPVKKHTGYANSTTKYNIGKASENKVYNKMINDGRFMEVIGVSQILDSVNGDDNLHYDISYKKRNEPNIQRYLEVKTAHGTKDNFSFILTSNEYNFGREHLDNYDIAVVLGDNVFIVEAFLNSKDLNPIPKDYEFHLEEAGNIEEENKL